MLPGRTRAHIPQTAGELRGDGLFELLALGGFERLPVGVDQRAIGGLKLLKTKVAPRAAELLRPSPALAVGLAPTLLLTCAPGHLDRVEGLAQKLGLVVFRGLVWRRARLLRLAIHVSPAARAPRAIAR